MRSRNKYDIYEWIKRVIDSSQTRTQIITCSMLIKNFDRLVNDATLTEELYEHRRYVRRQISRY